MSSTNFGSELSRVASNAVRREGPPSASAFAVGQRLDESRLDPPYNGSTTFSHPV